MTPQRHLYIPRTEACTAAVENTIRFPTRPSPCGVMVDREGLLFLRLAACLGRRSRVSGIVEETEQMGSSSFARHLRCQQHGAHGSK